MVREGLKVPAAVGANVTVIVQLAPEAKVAPQVVVRENGAARVPMVTVVAVTLPLLRRVRTWVGDGLVPVNTFPNATRGRQYDQDRCCIGALILDRTHVKPGRAGGIRPRMSEEVRGRVLLSNRDVVDGLRALVQGIVGERRSRRRSSRSTRRSAESSLSESGPQLDVDPVVAFVHRCRWQ